jgi:hypothetical protein
MNGAKDKNRTKAEELVEQIRELETQKGDLEHGLVSVGNSFTKKPFFRTTETKLFWHWNAEKELSYEMRIAFKDFLRGQIRKIDRQISGIRKQLKIQGGK